MFSQFDVYDSCHTYIDSTITLNVKDYTVVEKNSKKKMWNILKNYKNVHNQNI